MFLFSLPPLRASIAVIIACAFFCFCKMYYEAHELSMKVDDLNHAISPFCRFHERAFWIGKSSRGAGGNFSFNFFGKQKNHES